MHHRKLLLAALALLLAPARLWADEDKPAEPAAPVYTQQQNVVYYDSDDGVALVIDIFTPTGKKNGLGVVDVVSGSWSAARGRLEDHKKARIFDIICGRGYTVFAIRPGSISKYTAKEMLSNLKTGIRWVKAHAGDYDIDPNKLTICGASAGGHLASLAIVTAEDAEKKPKNELEKFDTRLAAAVIFFPPTDFLNWGGVELKEGETSPVMMLMGKLVFNDGTKGHSIKDINKQLEKISPARMVTGKEPPCLLIHGDADPIVPLQQSEALVEALKAKNVPVELIIKPGGGHPWPTIYEEVAIAADWIDKRMKGDTKPTETKAAAEQASAK